MSRPQNLLLGLPARVILRRAPASESCQGTTSTWRRAGFLHIQVPAGETAACLQLATPDASLLELPATAPSGRRLVGSVYLFPVTRLPAQQWALAHFFSYIPRLRCAGDLGSRTGRPPSRSD